ncbi:MAG: hypothetical protein FJ279_27445, partial [Planctomycetes bacterium]|nr:hypothetical protein [Planctomycetota bacterium]
MKAEGGHAAHVTVEMKLPANSEAMDVVLKAQARQQVALGALRGPAVCVGDRTRTLKSGDFSYGTGAKKGQAFFPGLEYLEGDEPSSSTRDLAPPLHLRLVPHKFKVTVPMMMVETQPGGPAMAVVWDPRQKWDGEHSAPAACFASPNFVAQQDNHLMQLFVPSVPDYVAENERTASLKPYVLEPGKDLTLRQFIVAGKPPLDATGGFTWLDRLVGFPSAESWPRSFEDEMALCRHGFMKTVWDEASQKHLHYVGSGKANAPGFATLMLMDARAVAKGDEKRRLLERVKLVAEKTLREQGVGGLVSHALCHVMSGEFPYHWGHLPGALEGLRAQAYASLDSQEADGGWGYYPDEKRSKLGERGTRVIGISARHAYLMAKYAAITGDPEVLDGLKRALEHLRRFKVPRGAQGWECPILEPDVLASAYAVRAYVWTHIATGEERWLDDARYWARTGLAFQYAWDDAQHPGMRYASIPVFGSTFFTHTWIGLPVQWCGLVYAYALQELMRFDRHEWWRKQAEGITVSAMFQQWPMDSEKLAGSYPDSWGQWFTRRNPVHINPEDIAVNVLALKGLDPGLRSVGVKLGDGVVRLTAPADVKASVSGQQVQAEMKYVPGETFYATLAPVAVSEGTRIAVAEQVLPRRETLAAGETGWAYDARLKALAVGMKADAGGTARLTASGLSYSLPETPKLKVGWEFESDAEGWSAGHSCQVKAENGRLVITVTGHDPYALSGPAEIPANTHKRLRMRLRLSAGRGVALFWRSKQAPNWGPDKETLVNVSATGGWHEVTFDLSKHPLWAGKVLQLRLDPEPPDVAAGTTL